MTTAPVKTYSEIRWGDDMDPSGADTDSDLESLEQDVLHVIAQTIGSNPDDEGRGIGAVGYLGGTSTALAAMPALIDAQLLDDPRITECHSTIALQDDGTYLIAVTISVAGSVLALPFTLGPGGLTAGG